MGLFRRDTPVTATVSDKPLQCLICAADQFWQRELKMNTTAMEFLDLGWANQSSLGLVCAACGYVHEFLGDAVKLWKPQT